jgi:DNA polymerase-1
MPLTLLLDADIIAYQYAFTSQKVIRFSPEAEPCVSYTPFEDVCERVDSHIGGLLQTLGADDLIVCQSCPTVEGFRIKLWPQYKAGRPPKPLYVEPIRAYLAENYKTYAKPQLEADDIQGILSTHPTLIKGKKVIVSVDKDMKTIPGWLFNPTKDKTPKLISEDQADYFWMLQTLTGDQVDHYPGIPGVGEKRGMAILDCQPDRYWECVVEAYEDRGLTAADALIQARLARILRHTDYDFEKGQPILWEPSHEAAALTM